MSRELNKLTVKEIIYGLRKGDFTTTDVVNDCIDRIDQLDGKLKAFITVSREYALKRAEEVDKIIKKLGDEAFEKYALLGVPYAAKDNYSTKDILTTGSSKMLENYIPPFDSTAIKKLNDAGAILLGKTNMDAFAHGSSTETSDFGTSYNPWNTSKVPGGSSGGSAAAVSADMCIFATGSETGGSTRGPASWCGVTGVKPTYGKVSRYGIIAMASSTDSPGPITKTVEDAAIVLKVMAGKDPFDATSLPNEVEDYVNYLDDFDIRGMKIGKPASYFEMDLQDGVKDRINEAMEVFKELGAEIVDMDLLTPKYSIAVYTILQRSEVSSNLGRLDGIRYGNPRTSFGFEAKKRIMLGTYALSSGYYDAYYANAQRVRTLIIEDFKKEFEKVDLLIAPSMPCVALDVGESEKSSMFGELMDVLNEPSCIAGLPGITVPCGFHKDLPVGVQLIGDLNKEKDILCALHKYQQVTNYHKERPKLWN